MRKFTKYPSNYVRASFEPSSVAICDWVNREAEFSSSCITASRTVNHDVFQGRIPKNIKDRTIENMEVYYMGLADAFEEACRELAPKGSELWKAWYYNDYRKFIPSAYIEKYLDFDKYPLNY